MKQKRIRSFFHGFTIWHFQTYANGDWSINATHWIYLTNHAYAGEQRYYLRLGHRPFGHIFHFGQVVRGD